MTTTLQTTAAELKFCDCAKCGCELLGDSFRDWFYSKLSLKEQEDLPFPVAGRVDERPYCADCLGLVKLLKKRKE